MRQLRIAPHLTTPVEFIQLAAMRQVRIAPHLTTSVEFIQVAVMTQVGDNPTSHNPC